MSQLLLSFLEELKKCGLTFCFESTPLHASIVAERLEVNFHQASSADLHGREDSSLPPYPPPPSPIETMQAGQGRSRAAGKGGFKEKREVFSRPGLAGPAR